MLHHMTLTVCYSNSREAGAVSPRGMAAILVCGWRYTDWTSINNQDPNVDDIADFLIKAPGLLLSEQLNYTVNEFCSGTRLFAP